ncbi:MAG: sulfatase/phosphatase domain-containing protein, partial [Anaerolineae bacterium]
TLLEANGLPISKHIQGKSLLPLLTGQVAPDYHRDFVRCEYHDALNLPLASHANMLRTERYKLVVYHGCDVGELYDLQEDPDEYVNLWDDAEMKTVKYDLMKQLFDAVMLAVDEGIERVGRF